ncbi:MAG: hypothetical protein ACLUEK_07405 [Oscillospiraceae bacterium]
MREKLSQAQWALGCVKRRRDTLLSCASVIVEEQREFFEKGSGALRPCSMAEVASRVGVHPSTVSRAVKDKYISCRWGVFPMSYFFAKEVCGETQGDILQEIVSIIRRGPETAAERQRNMPELASRARHRPPDVA